MRVLSPQRRERRSALRSLTVVVAVLGLGLVPLEGTPGFLRTGDGVRLFRVEALHVFGPAEVNADPGDFVLESESIALTVAASVATPERRQSFGRILDLTASDWDDESLESFSLMAKVGGKPVKLQTVSVQPVHARGAPAIRIIHDALGGRLDFRTTIRVEAGKPYAEVTTRILNRGKSQLTGVSVGDDVAWPGLPTFVPGLGDVETSGKREVSWFGMRGTKQAYVLAYPDGPWDAEFAVGRHSYQIAWSPPRTLEPGAALRFRRYFIASYRSFADAASWAHRLTGRAVGTVVGQLSPPVKALITAIDTDGTVALRSDVEADGSFSLPLPPGRYTLVLRTVGGVTDLLVDVSATGPPTEASFVVPRPGTLVFRVTDASERLMPARLLIRGVGKTPDPEFGPDFRAAGGKSEIHSLTGSGEIDLAPGTYEVLVTRGPEYSLMKRRVVVDAGRGVALWAILVREVEIVDWIACDFHLHAEPSSDSQVTLADRIASLVAAGVEFAAATDHNHVTDYDPAVRALRADPLLTTAVGVEITTKDWGHFNVFPLEPSAKTPPYAGIKPTDVFAYVRRNLPSALIQVNHPWMPGYGYFHRAGVDEKTGEPAVQGFSSDFDVLEVVNGYELAKSVKLEDNLRRWFDLLNVGFRQTAVGNSDSHRVSREWAGYPRTYVSIAGSPDVPVVERVAESLRRGRATVSFGPFVQIDVNGGGPGDLVSVADGTATVSVLLRAADWIDADRVEIVVDGLVVDVLPATLFDNGGVRVDRTVEIPLESDAWIVALARGNKPIDSILPGLMVPPFAFTNPVYVDVDGDGAYTPPSEREDLREGPPAPPRRPAARERAKAGRDGGLDAAASFPIIPEPDAAAAPAQPVIPAPEGFDGAVPLPDAGSPPAPVERFPAADAAPSE